MINNEEKVGQMVRVGLAYLGEALILAVSDEEKESEQAEEVEEKEAPKKEEKKKTKKKTAKKAAPKKEEKEAEEIDVGKVKKALMEYAKNHGKEAAYEVLEKFGAKKVKDLEANDLKAVYQEVSL